MSRMRQFGRYLLLKKLATGGMAELFLGKQIGLEGFEKPVVLKRILPHLAENEDFITMFLDEARVAARLNHPRIVQIYDLGKEGDSYYIAMEYIRGQDLRKIIKRAQSLREPVPLGIAIRILVGVLEGLDHAHRQTDENGRPIHLVHRDVSPQNILVSYEGDVKLVDFGIAKASTQIYQTRAGILKGKYAYMSPEQAQGRPVDRRSDIFAAGILLYEVTTGRRLFRQPSEIETLRKVIDCVVEAPSLYDPNYPPDLEQEVLRALQKDPAERFQDAREMQLALERFVTRHGMLSSGARLAEYMQRVFAHEMEAATEELRVLMEARPETPPPALSPLSGEPEPTRPPGLPAVPAGTPVRGPPPLPSRPGGEAPLFSPQGARTGGLPALPEPTLVLDSGTLGQPPAGSSPSPTPVPAPRSEPSVSSTLEAPVLRRRRLILFAVTLIALAAATAVVVWRLSQQRRASAPPEDMGAWVPGPPTPPPGMGPGLPRVQTLSDAGPGRAGSSASRGPFGPSPGSPPDAGVVAEAKGPESDDEPQRPRRRRKPRPPTEVSGATLLSVQTTPRTRVYHGGLFLGETPLQRSLAAGEVTLRLRNPELGIDFPLPLALKPGGQVEITKTFRQGKLKVRVEPWAEVVLDGRSLGETPLPPQTLYEGEHLLVLSNPRLGKREILRIQVKADETTLVERVWKE
jgi:serine/threonine protein kinase